MEAAVEVCREFLDSMKEAGPSAVKTEAKLRIPPPNLPAVAARVEEHYGQNGFTDTELNRLAEQAGQAVRERAAGPEQRAVAYGSTLLVAVVTEEFLVCFQLGDGDILAVSNATGVAERAVPKDETLIANETTSLCQEEGQRYMRCGFQLFQAPRRRWCCSRRMATATRLPPPTRFSRWARTTSTCSAGGGDPRTD